ncbi:hypothetical protein PoB_000315000 [Plakobranchus ocellatus]|uniref:Uncharacterized protein n=1 Tax=Plakobranchus ocellatus TaxID=259542 RepID=A0AAV3Y1U7_9GAST|nr:hypothetical protein PoB_000315000 [Plakobranchus ocellatus]
MSFKQVFGNGFIPDAALLPFVMEGEKAKRANNHRAEKEEQRTGRLSVITTAPIHPRRGRPVQFHIMNIPDWPLPRVWFATGRKV